MEWIVGSCDRRTDRDGQKRFTSESAFISAGGELLGNIWTGLCAGRSARSNRCKSDAMKE